MSTLGDMLYKARKDAGYSLPEISNGTHIRLSYLEALEDGHYDELPVKGYVRLFINSYVNYCHLDPLPFLAQYEREIGTPPDEAHVERPIQATEVVAPQGKQHTIDWRVALVICGVIAIIAFTIWLAFSLANKKSDVSPAPVTPASVETTSTDKVITTTTSKPFKLDITVDEGSATEVKLIVDGAVAYEGVLTSSNRLTYDVESSAQITVANPAIIKVKRDGEDYALPQGNNITVDLKASK